MKQVDENVTNIFKGIQYSKKLVIAVVVMAFVFSVFGYYMNLKNGYSMDDIITQWIEFAKWISGLYLAKAFAETYAEEKNNLEREKSNIHNVTSSNLNDYEDVEI